MNTFKRLTAAVALSTAFFAHNVQAAPSDAVCVALGKWGGAVIELKKLGVSEKEQVDRQTANFKDKRQRAIAVNVIRYIYLDDSAYVDAKYLYLKCKIGDFDA